MQDWDEKHLVLGASNIRGLMVICVILPKCHVFLFSLLRDKTQIISIDCADIMETWTRICITVTSNGRHCVSDTVERYLFLSQEQNNIPIFQYQIHVGWIKDRFVYAPSQWETTLQCNAASHWLGAWKHIDVRSKEQASDTSSIMSTRIQHKYSPVTDTANLVIIGSDNGLSFARRHGNI